MKKILFLAIVLMSCGSKNDYWQMKLPAHFNSKQPEQLTELLPDSVRDKKFTKALLFESGDTKTFLSIPMPVFEFSSFVQTVGKDGKEIESLHLINPFETTTFDVTINPDRTIVRIDSTYAVVADDNGNVDETVRMLSVVKTTYRVTDAGKIEVVSEEGL